MVCGFRTPCQMINAAGHRVGMTNAAETICVRESAKNLTAIAKIEKTDVSHMKLSLSLTRSTLVRRQYTDGLRLRPRLKFLKTSQIVTF